jgi:hypothetical protein
VTNSTRMPSLMYTSFGEFVKISRNATSADAMRDNLIGRAV